MSGLDKGLNNIGAKVESKKGERGPLSSNKANVRSPFLEFNPNSEYVTEDIALDHLASILAEIYLHHISHVNKQKGSNLLSGLDKRAS